MAKLSRETEKIRYFTDYSNHELIDFSLETFKYFDRYGMKVVNSRFTIKGEIYHDDFFLNSNNIFEEIGIEFKDKSSEQFRILEKGFLKIPIEVEYFFFLNFYKESKKYKSLFKKFGTGWFYDETSGLGNGKLLNRIKEQLLRYTELYLNINIGKYLKVNEKLSTIVNNNGSPILYQSAYNLYHVCRRNDPYLSFGNFNNFNNDKITTFENIETIESFYLYDNNTVRDLGSIHRIKKICSLRNSSIENLGNLKFVDDSLIIEKCHNIKIIENINIGANLSLRGSEINTLKNLVIKGNLLLNMKFKENYIIENCIIEGQIKFLNPISRE